MKIWKDKFGNKLTAGEFFSRWKHGLAKVTPLQQVNIQIKGTYIIILGLCAGIFICSLNIKTLWWLMVILVGGLVNTSVQLLGLWQKKVILAKFDLFSVEDISLNNQKEVKENELLL